MIRNKLLVTLSTTIVLIVGLLAVHMVENIRELYLHKKMSWMHHEYTTILNIKYAVNVQINEGLIQVLFGHDLKSPKYKEARKEVNKAFEDIFNTISQQIHAAYSGDEVAVEEEEKHRTLDLKNKYVQIDRKFEQINILINSHQDERVKITQHLHSIDQLFAEFVVLTEIWRQEEKKEIEEVEENFNFLTHRDSIMLTIGSIVTISLSIALSLSLFRTINTRLTDLVKGTERVAKGQLDTPILLKGKDELTYLSREFNTMMEKLQASQKKLLEQSYYSGMAEMVSGILHNIKNAFSPFVVDTEMVRRKMGKLKFDHLETALKEFDDDTISKERKKDLKDLAFLVVENSKELLLEISTKLEEMQEKAFLVEKVMEDQGRFAQSGRFREIVGLHDLVKDSLTLVKKDFLDRVPVVIDQSLEEVGVVSTQRIILMQVISNIIVNAIEAVLRAEKFDSPVLVQAGIEDENGVEIIHIRVSDDGDGIDTQEIDTIFQRGTSSKKRRSGLGLHWCANSVAALGGRIYAESHGKGKGACFHLLLERKQKEQMPV